MTNSIINLSRKSLISLLLCLIMLFSVFAPTAFAVTSESEDAKLKQEIDKLKQEVEAYEKEKGITGEVIDFSSIDFTETQSVSSSTEGSTNTGNYQIVKNGKDYTITLDNVIAKKIILPVDEADKGGIQVTGEDEEPYSVPAYTGKPRENHITIILKGNNTVTGYGIEGYPVKGIKFEGSGNLTINAYTEPVVGKVSRQKGDEWVTTAERTNYIKAGISVETGDQKFENKDAENYDDENSLVFAGTGNITINAPDYHGIINNGDIRLGSGNIKINAKKTAISGYRVYIGNKVDVSSKVEPEEDEDENYGIAPISNGLDNKPVPKDQTIKIDAPEDTRVQFELISGERAFYEKPMFTDGEYTIYASKTKGTAGADDSVLKTKKDIENNYLSYRYVCATHVEYEKDKPVFSDNVKEGETYCTLPVVTVTDDTGIASITVNDKKLSSSYYRVNTAKKAEFVVPALDNVEKHIVVIDIFGNKSEITFKAYEFHKINVTKEIVKEATCTTNGSHRNIYTCEICKQQLNSEGLVDKALGHEFNEWVEKGNIRERKCKNCEYTETEDLTKNISSTSISLSSSNYVYDGNKKEPTVTVKDGSKKLSEGKDYTLTYNNNVLAGTASVKVTGINKYNNAVSKTFTIAKAQNSITASNITKNYSSKAQSFSIGAKQKGDAKLTYSSNNSQVAVNGNGSVTVKAGFSGKAVITITANATSKYEKATKQITITVLPAPKAPVASKSASQAKVTKVNNSITASNFTKKASKNAQSFSIGAKQAGNAKLTYSSNNKNVTVNSSGKVTIKAGFSGKATITITANANAGYNKATKSIVVTVQKANNSITAASSFTKTYSSKAQSFSIGAKQAGNAKLTYSSNNKNVTVNGSGKVTIKKGFIGKATITITANATSAYNKATKKVTVTVNPPKISISKLSNVKGKKMTIKWSKNTAVTGYEIQYSTDKNFKKGVSKVTVSKKSTVSKTVSKLSKNKKYYVRIRSYKTVSRVKYYSGWSSVKNVTIKK